MIDGDHVIASESVTAIVSCRVSQIAIASALPIVTVSDSSSSHHVIVTAIAICWPTSSIASRSAIASDGGFASGIVIAIGCVSVSANRPLQW